MDFKKLAEEVSNATVGRTRMTDLKTGKYSIQIDPKSETHVFLVSEKKQKTAVSITALAAMRIVKSKADAETATTTADARDNTAYTNLQDSVVNEGTKIDDKTTLEVVHKLQIKDTVSGDLVYKNEHYKEYPKYVAASRKAAAITADNERNLAFTEASDALRAGGLKQPVAPAIEKNLITMPVFILS